MLFRSLINRFGAIEDFPPEALGDRRDLALLFKKLATLKTDAPLFADIDALQWRGPTAQFAEWADRLGAPKLLARALKAYRSARP